MSRETITPTPCPVCAAPAGFHADAAHSVARLHIPEHLVRPSNNEMRRERKAHEHGAVSK